MVLSISTVKIKPIVESQSRLLLQISKILCMPFLAKFIFPSFFSQIIYLSVRTSNGYLLHRRAYTMPQMKIKMEEVRECQPPNSLPKTKTTTMEGSEAPPTSALDTTVRAASPVKPVVSGHTLPRFGGPSITLNPGHKRKAPVAAVWSAADKRVKAPNLRGCRATITTPGLETSKHGPFDDIEWHNSVLEDPEKLRLENSQALVAVYEGILETLAQIDLDLRNLEEMMVDHGYITEYASKNDDAEGK